MATTKIISLEEYISKPHSFGEFRTIEIKKGVLITVHKQRIRCFVNGKASYYYQFKIALNVVLKGKEDALIFDVLKSKRAVIKKLQNW